MVLSPTCWDRHFLCEKAVDDGSASRSNFIALTRHATNDSSKNAENRNMLEFESRMLCLDDWVGRFNIGPCYSKKWRAFIGRITDPLFHADLPCQSDHAVGNQKAAVNYSRRTRKESSSLQSGWRCYSFFPVCGWNWLGIHHSICGWSNSRPPWPGPRYIYSDQLSE